MTAEADAHDAGAKGSLQRGSLRWRLLAGGLIWLVIALAAAGLFLNWQFRSHVTEDFDSALLDRLERLTATLIVTPDGELGLTETPVDPRFREVYSGLYWQVARGGETILSSRSLWDATLPLPDDTLAPGEVHRYTGIGPREEALVLLERLVRLRGQEGAIRLTVAQTTADLERAIRRFNQALLAALAGLALALGAAVFLQVQVGLAPLARLRRALFRLREGGADRVEGGFPAEIAPALDDLNAMLARNNRLIAGARRQAGDLAHALKTPLAVALGGSSAEDDETRKALMQMQRIIDHHTARARAVGGRTRVGLRTDLAPRIRQLADTLRRLSGDRGPRIALDIPDVLQASIDPEDFTEILGALLENACKWASGQVSVQAAVEDGSIALRIDDDGPGIPDERHADVMEVGGRLDESKPGTGLGLSIARDLSALYGGDVCLSRSGDLGGLRVDLTLPVGGGD